LAKWNAERGFGFIAPAGGGAEVFVHISAFPRDGVAPIVGEILSYEKHQAQDGKTKAVLVMRPGTKSRSSNRSGNRGSARQTRKPSGLGIGVAAIGLLAALGTVAYSFIQTNTEAPATATQPLHLTSGHSDTLAFKCDGRRRCSQMSSCEEATQFLRHCPGMEMDGDGDGVPCEREFCN
jgi:cold shock CspA family protein